MDERILKWLFDIKIAIEEIEDYFKTKPKEFLAYKNDIMLKRAVERDLEIIGEAMNRILKRDPSFEKRITASKSIVGLRNEVIHAYDSISDENIWSILINHLPKLKSEVETLLSDEL